VLIASGITVENGNTVGAIRTDIHYLGAAAHPIGQHAAVDAMMIGEFQKLRAIDLIRQNLQRLVSLLRKTQATQGINQPLSAVRHRRHHTRLQSWHRTRC
jgi:hypothetical protein